MISKIKKKFKKGDFIKNKNPYPGEGEHLVVDFDYHHGEWYGYKCANLKGKHVAEHDFNNLMIVDKWHQDSYEKVG